MTKLTRTLALEAIDHGIRVNAIGPGDANQSDGRTYLAEHGCKAPITCGADPEEIDVAPLSPPRTTQITWRTAA